MSYGAIVVIAAVIIFILLIFYFYNKIINLRNRADEAFSGIDVQYKKRFDLIPNLVQTVKEYMTYEKDTLNHLTELRTKALSGSISQDEYIKLSEEVDKLVKSIIVSAENYPDLKASEQYLNLQNNLSKIESELQAARRIYNIEVTNYNKAIKVVPKNIVANRFGFKEEELFEIEEKKKENIKVNFEE